MLFITFEQGVVRGLVEGEDEGSQVREGDLLVPRDGVDSPGRQRRGAVLGNIKLLEFTDSVFSLSAKPEMRNLLGGQRFSKLPGQ